MSVHFFDWHQTSKTTETEDKMSVKFFKSLLFKSAQIQTEIEREQNRVWPDWMRLLKLKKIRLSIKDKMLRLARSRPDAAAYFRFSPVYIRVRKGR